MWRRRASPGDYEAELDDLVAARARFAALVGSAGWAAVGEEVAEQLRAVLAKMAEGGLSHIQYERLSARVEVFLWLHDLPAAKIASYDEYLKALRRAERASRQGPDDGPVPRDAVEDVDVE